MLRLFFERWPNLASDVGHLREKGKVHTDIVWSVELAENTINSINIADDYVHISFNTVCIICPIVLDMYVDILWSLCFVYTLNMFIHVCMYVCSYLFVCLFV